MTLKKYLVRRIELHAKTTTAKTYKNKTKPQNREMLNLNESLIIRVKHLFKC